MTVTLANAQALSGQLIKYGPAMSLRSEKNTHVSENLSHTAALTHLVNQSKNTLFTASNIFPFDIFPDSISIDENKVSIVRRNFFGIRNIHSILINDITDVTVDTYIFWAALNIVDSSNYRFPITLSIDRLTIKDALEARRLIQGLVATKRQGIDLSSLTIKDARQGIGRIGDSD